MLGLLAISVLACAQKPLPIEGSHQQEQTQPLVDKAQSVTPPPCASEVCKENAENAERYAYYKAHPGEYLKAAIAPANLSNWILAGIGIVGSFIAVITLWTFKRQTDQIVISERGWMVASMKVGPNNPRIASTNEIAPIYAECIHTNKGKTPVFVLEAGMGIWVATDDDPLPDNPPPYDPRYTMKWEANGISIPPKMSIVRQVFKETANPIFVLTGSSDLYVYGFIKYSDAFKARGFWGRRIRETRFCFRYIPGKPQFGMNAHFFIEGPPAYNRAT
jgi:hypothetical protein